MKRILVLGSAPHSRNVDAYAWDALPSPLTVADYDVVILNLVPLGDDALLGRCDRAAFPSVFDYGKLIFSKGSTLIFIGSPASREIESHPQSGVHRVSSIDPKSWLPKAPVFRFDSGEVIRTKLPEYEWYFEKVRRWIFYADDHFSDTEMPQEWFEHIGFPRANFIASILMSIAETRFGRAIAFVLRYRLVRVESLGRGVFNKGRQRKETISDSGYVVWLPAPTEMTDYEAVNLILAKRFSIATEHEPPAWVSGYTLVRQNEVQSLIDRLQQKTQEILAHRATAEADFEHQRRYRKLLYEQGDSLENIVWSVLEELGATVERPSDRGKDDGRLVEPNGRQGVLEIKGRTGQIGLNDVRQCDQWARDCIAETTRDSKGLLIGNAHCGTPLAERSDWFASNAVGAAERFEICLFKTSALFRAIQEVQEGSFDCGAFWDSVFSTNGVCALPDVVESPQSAS